MRNNVEYPLEKLKRINPEKIKQIHLISIKYGKTQDTGIREEGSLINIADGISKMAVNRKDMVTIVAYVLEKLVKYHPFWDGNHRTAYELGHFICILFGYRLDIIPSQAIEFMRRIDSENLSARMIKTWVKEKAVAMKDQ
jgi:death-on-curing family protein